MIKPADFEQELLRLFPDLGREVAEDASDVHMQLASFARRTQKAIDSHAVREVRDAFELARRILLDGDAELKNALHVSYLEHLHLDDGRAKRAWARDLLSPSLKQALDELGTYVEELFKRER